MITIENPEFNLEDAIEVALASTALFDQYDEVAGSESANDPEYDNLYPYIG